MKSRTYVSFSSTECTSIPMLMFISGTKETKHMSICEKALILSFLLLSNEKKAKTVAQFNGIICDNIIYG